MFSLGCLFYAILFGIMPFLGETKEEVLKLNKLC